MVLQLRSYIPIGAPARREPADGTEPTLRVSLGFEPAWFHKRCGVDFSERWHGDPVYRYESLKVMKAALVKAFPRVRSWDPANEEDLATLSGCYGICVVPKVFGIPLRYRADGWPACDPIRKLSTRDIGMLDVKRLLDGPFVEELFHQMDVIESEWGKIAGYLNWQGVLNNAFHLRGQDVFLDLHDRPAFVHDFFSLITEVMIRLARMVQERQRRSGFYVNQLSVSNCTMNMLSPEMYRRFVLPYDTKIARAFERFGVHTCNWDVTPYTGVLRELPNLGYLDMGLMSDLAKVKGRFPEPRRAVIYSPVRLQEAPPEAIRQDLERVYDELAPCDLVMADVRVSTPDSRVNEVLDLCTALSGCTSQGLACKGKEVRSVRESLRVTEGR